MALSSLSVCKLDASSCTLFKSLIKYLVEPTMLLLAAFAVVVFLWGMVQFLWHAREGKGLDEGKMHMLWGVIGLFIIFASYAIIAFIENTVVGLSGAS